MGLQRRREHGLVGDQWWLGFKQRWRQRRRMGSASGSSRYGRGLGRSGIDDAVGNRSGSRRQSCEDWSSCRQLGMRLG
ncbi:hypothetical protein M0R45_001951 [Rubus argutus]|uniref:Uncharacterized protein n=1 Tax=Rubus argutus TaxID=59490 RepID=A0AAW1VJ03_RUBAR